MRRLLAALCRKWVAPPDVTTGNAQFLVGDVGDNDLSYAMAGQSSCEVEPGLYFDGVRMPQVEWPPPDAGVAKPDNADHEADNA